jgi:hypothetical protein
MLFCECSEEKMDMSMVSLLKFHNTKVATAKEASPTVEDSCEAFLKLNAKNSSNKCSSCLVVSVELELVTKGFATTLHFKCKETTEPKGHTVSIEPQKVSSSFFSANKDCHSLYWVNYLVVLLMHRNGCGMYHA